jgi:hypothetical protein
MDLKTLKKQLTDLKNQKIKGFFIPKNELDCIDDLVQNGAVKINRENGYIYLNFIIAAKQRIKEYLTVLNIKINSKK